MIYCDLVTFQQGSANLAMLAQRQNVVRVHYHHLQGCEWVFLAVFDLDVVLVDAQRS